MKKYRVIFHLDENIKSKADMVFGNILNLISDLGDDNVDVELVANSEGVLTLLKEPNWHIDQINRIQQKNVKITVCANSLRYAGINKDSLIDKVEIVPAGVSEIVKRQVDGWAYIKP